ncbi:MAG: hypothetical protein QOF51_3244 [Chloroflexota bacterium]|nr:hypothetical protein [Chloroflexota bacterium]
MLLTITNTRPPATDLSFLLHKHPDRVQSFPLSFGQAHVFYPEASEARCTAALLLDVDAVGLVRGLAARGRAGEAQYVNDRPYVASSFMSVAIADVYGTALGGRSQARQETAETALPLTARLAVVHARGGPGLLAQLFEPLGYTLVAERHMLDEHFPEWGESPYYTLQLSGEVRLQDLLSHLYVLLPVLDDDKHYWVGDEEVEKLLRHGEGWLASHPARELITARYLRHRHTLMRDALARLVEGDEDPDAAEEAHAAEEQAIERPLSLNRQRIATAIDVLKEVGASTVLDLGCGEGNLLGTLVQDRSFARILGVDVSYRALERAKARLHLDRQPPDDVRVQLLQGALTYRDRRLAGFDAAAVLEVIEHLEPTRLDAFAEALFGGARPGTVVLTTPNVEYNVRFESLPAGTLRHRDHRFEWTRAELGEWSSRVAERFGYEVRLEPIGPQDPDVGSPTQMAVFTRS